MFHFLPQMASSKGLVHGRLAFVLQGIRVHALAQGGQSIPGNVQAVTDLVTDARAILVIEKDCIFQVDALTTKKGRREREWKFPRDRE